MYVLTKIEGDLESGAFASMDDEGTPIVNFFECKDDAVTYVTMLEAIGQDIAVTEIENDLLDKFCGVLDHAYTIVDEGDIVIPRLETLQHSLIDLNPFRDLF